MHDKYAFHLTMTSMRTDEVRGRIFSHNFVSSSWMDNNFVRILINIHINPSSSTRKVTGFGLRAELESQFSSYITSIGN
jgi:hypothetical protein